MNTVAAPSKFSGPFWAVVWGAVFGAITAAMNLDRMRSAVFETTALNEGFRILVGAAFFAQVFLLVWIGAWIVRLLLGAAVGRLRSIESGAWTLSALLTTSLGLVPLVRINRALPSITSAKSIAGNLGLALVLFGLFLVFALFFSKTKILTRLFRIGGAVLFVIFEGALIFALSISAPGVKLPENQAGDHPNILLVTVDTLRADHLSCYGYEKIKTENIDRLAAGSVLYENAISTSSWTLPVFATIFTGVPEQVHGVNRHNTALPEGFQTVAEILSRQSYATAAVVTNEFLNHPYAMDQGFDSYLFSSDPAAYSPFEGLFLYDFLFAQRLERHNAKNMTDRAVDMLEGLAGGSFFLWVHYIDPHTPYGAWYIDRLPDYDAGYDGPIGREFSDVDGIDSDSLRLTDKDKQHIQALYDSEILYVDRQIGRLLDTLDRLELADDTVVIFTSDHGEEFWDHGGVVHGRTLFVESVHVPLIIRLPGKNPKHERIADLVSLMDIAPTILSFGRARIPEVMRGANLFAGNQTAQAFSYLDKLTPDEKRYLADGVYDNDRAYIETFAPMAEKFLFDFKTDQEQRRSLFGEDPQSAIEMSEIIAQDKKRSADQRQDMDFLKSGNTIELSPQSKQALKGLGYLN